MGRNRRKERMGRTIDEEGKEKKKDRVKDEGWKERRGRKGEGEGNKINR